jgi:hypothetical protein
LEKEDGKQYYACSKCKSDVSREYTENSTGDVEVICAVGFRGHGKTLYFSSLFYSLDILASIWPGFYSFATDERSLDTVKENIIQLRKGELPPPNPASFPVPTITRFSYIPSIGNRFYIFYDTGGESYTRASKLIKYAGFVKRSKTVIFLISPVDIDYDGTKMHDLLSTYVQGLTEMGGKPKKQNLLVVFSKGDMLGSKLAEWKQIRSYLAGGSLESLRNLRLGSYFVGMKLLSTRLKKFAKKELNATQFVNFAQDEFKSVNFSLISSLGAKPEENRLQVEINPKCIFDPLLWVSFQSLGWLRRSMLLWKK